MKMSKYKYFKRLIDLNILLKKYFGNYLIWTKRFKQSLKINQS